MAAMTEPLTHLLERLLADWENEVVEFKEAARQFSVKLDLSAVLYIFYT